MDLSEGSVKLYDLLQSNRTVFVRTEPETLDFTDATLGKVLIFGEKDKVELDVSSQNIKSVIGLLDATVFDKAVVDRLYFWNIKSLASYTLKHIAKFVTPRNNLIDLKPIEGFLGEHKKPPESLQEVFNRARIVVENKSWLAIYRSIHLPLSLRVLPSIETTPLLNEQLRRSEYPCYEIEGQTNGRLNCSKKFAKSYLPHNMGPDIRKVMKPLGYGLRFVSADFRFCEVAVLQWLTQDEKLLEILNSGEDLHSRIYEIVTGDPCDTDTKRKISKKMFLPVVFGLGASGLAANLGLTEAVGVELHSRIYTIFGTALNWVGLKQQQAKSGIVTDYFGRPRKFAPDQAYLARNFVVQAVAATFCQEKLVELWKAFHQLQIPDQKLAYSVHDGYCGICKVSSAKQTYDIMKDVLESESKLCPGLKLKVEIKFGARLDSMKVLWR